jgi:hypothetical protein
VSSINALPVIDWNVDDPVLRIEDANAKIERIAAADFIQTRHGRKVGLWHSADERAWSASAGKSRRSLRSWKVNG